MFPIRTTTNKLEIHEFENSDWLRFWSRPRQPLFRKTHTQLLLHGVNCFALHLEQLASFVSVLQTASDSLSTLFLLRGGGSRRNNLCKIKIQMTELIFRFYCIFLTLSCLVKQQLHHLVHSVLRKKQTHTTKNQHRQQRGQN